MRSSLAASAVGNRTFKIDSFDLPATTLTDGILRVEATGVCGSDLKKYAVYPMEPTILGHETVGLVEELGTIAQSQWGVERGDRVLLEEYLPCSHCSYCRSGEFRSCRETEVGRKGSIRYGSTPVSVIPSLWGGYSQYQYLHLRSVLHRVPEHVSAAYATFAIPLSNGIQWAQFDGGVRPGDTVIIQGPGQQGMGCLIASKEAGADRVIVSGRSGDAARLQIASELGAEHTVDVDQNDLSTAVGELTRGQFADVVIDVSGAGWATLTSALECVRRRGTIVLASGGRDGSEVGAYAGLDLIRKKQVDVRGVRGHSFRGVETALDYIGSDRAHVDRICEPSFALAEIGAAFEAAAGKRSVDALHVSVEPWKER